jgi:hypothetical protein
VSSIVAVAVSEPEVPLIVIEARPVTACLLAFSVRMLVPAVGFLLNAAVTPLGRPEAERLTLPVNPYTPVTVMVVSLEAPGLTVNEAGEALNVNVGAGFTVRTTEDVAVV